MPSPTWSTVPTSARSVSTSYCSIRCLRIEVISSGRSFTDSPWLAGDQFSSKLLEAAAHAGVDAQRPGLEDDAAEQVGINITRCFHGVPGRFLDPGHDRSRLLVGQ